MTSTKGAHGAFFRFDPGFESPVHTHTYDYYAVVIKGRPGELSAGRQAREAGTGLVLVSARQAELTRPRASPRSRARSTSSSRTSSTRRSRPRPNRRFRPSTRAPLYGWSSRHSSVRRIAAPIAVRAANQSRRRHDRRPGAAPADRGASRVSTARLPERQSRRAAHTIRNQHDDRRPSPNRTRRPSWPSTRWPTSTATSMAPSLATSATPTCSTPQPLRTALRSCAPTSTGFLKTFPERQGRYLPRHRRRRHRRRPRALDRPH